MRRSSSLFAFVVLAQLAVPTWMIVSHERVLNEGEFFKFKTAPIDPRDPFRGEYVMLNFDAESGNWADPLVAFDSTGAEQYGDRPAYASLAFDPDGYATITGLTVDPPSSGPYVKVTYWPVNDTTVDRVSLPFDRFYLEEGDGAKTENLVYQTNVQVGPEMPAYAQVRVYNGDAVIEDLIVGDKSIHVWLNEPPASAP